MNERLHTEEIESTERERERMEEDAGREQSEK